MIYIHGDHEHTASMKASGAGETPPGKHTAASVCENSPGAPWQR